MVPTLRVREDDLLGVFVDGRSSGQYCITGAEKVCSFRSKQGVGANLTCWVETRHFR